MHTPRRSAAVSLGLTLVVAGSLTGCARTAEVDTAGYCVDRATGQRVDDSECRAHHGGHAWYYVHNGTRYPGIGGRATGGSYTAPTGSSYVEGGLPRSSGTTEAGKVSGGTVHSVKTGGFGRSGGKSGS